MIKLKFLTISLLIMHREILEAIRLGIDFGAGDTWKTEYNLLTQVWQQSTLIESLMLSNHTHLTILL
jgi:hypothetical protein